MSHTVQSVNLTRLHKHKGIGHLAMTLTGFVQKSHGYLEPLITQDTFYPLSKSEKDIDLV